MATGDPNAPTGSPGATGADALGGYTPTALPPTQATPIGVPATYEPPLTKINYNPDYIGMGGMGDQQTSLGTLPSKHVYVEGDQWGPIHEPVGDIKSLQMQMIAAGLLDPTQVHMGVWDLNSADAYKTVLAQANTYGAAAPDMLDALVQNAPTSVKGQRAPFHLTNPIDIQAAVSGGGPGATNVARSLTGMDLPQSETQAFTKWYQDQEAQARTAYANADLTGGGTITDRPGLDAAAQEYIKQHNLAQTVAYGTASRMLQFFQLLQGPV